MDLQGIVLGLLCCLLQKKPELTADFLFSQGGAEEKGAASWIECWVSATQWVWAWPQGSSSALGSGWLDSAGWKEASFVSSSSQGAAYCRRGLLRRLSSAMRVSGDGPVVSAPGHWCPECCESHGVSCSVLPNLISQLLCCFLSQSRRGSGSPGEPESFGINFKC